MNTTTKTLRFGTRGSELALWQTNHVMTLLQADQPSLHVEYEIIKTRGDQVLDTPLPLVGGKGVFTAELEAALHEKRVDCAVHSLKDLPTENPQGLTIGAIPLRANPADALISREGYTLHTLPQGAKVGTSSTRRAAQLLSLRPDLHMIDIRGNVDTRIRKALDPDGDYDAIILAYAGLSRLGRTDVVTEILSFDQMLPAPGQGAIAVQTRDESALVETLDPIHHRETALAVAAERAFLAGLGGGCSVPVAALAFMPLADSLILRGRVMSPDGSQMIEVASSSPVDEYEAAIDLGTGLALEALDRGAKALLEQHP
jgi:hydroxymethylbilane synthase